MTIEAMKQALKAFEVATTHFNKDRREILDACESLRQAIAEAENKQNAERVEPVGRVDYWPSVGGGKYISNMVAWRHLPVGTLLYTSPQRQPLTDEQIKGIYEDCDAPTGGEFTLAFTRAIEAAHGIKGEA